MADGLNSYLEEGEAREPGQEDRNQKVFTARSGGLTVDIGQDLVHLPLANQRTHRERLVSSRSVLSRTLRSWVPEVGTAWGVGDNTRNHFLGAPKALRLPASSREPSQLTCSL